MNCSIFAGGKATRQKETASHADFQFVCCVERCCVVLLLLLCLIIPGGLANFQQFVPSPCADVFCTVSIVPFATAATAGAASGLVRAAQPPTPDDDGWRFCVSKAEAPSHMGWVFVVLPSLNPLSLRSDNVCPQCSNCRLAPNPVATASFGRCISNVHTDTQSEVFFRSAIGRLMMHWHWHWLCVAVWVLLRYLCARPPCRNLRWGAAEERKQWWCSRGKRGKMGMWGKMGTLWIWTLNSNKMLGKKQSTNPELIKREAAVLGQEVYAFGRIGWIVRSQKKHTNWPEIFLLGWARNFFVRRNKVTKTVMLRWSTLGMEMVERCLRFESNQNSFVCAACRRTLIVG